MTYGIGLQAIWVLIFGLVVLIDYLFFKAKAKRYFQTKYGVSRTFWIGVFSPLVTITVVGIGIDLYLLR